MAPASDSTFFGACTSYLGSFPEQVSRTKHNKTAVRKMARCSELKNFLVCLSASEPTPVRKLLGFVFKKNKKDCRNEQKAQATKKRTAPPEANVRSAKRLRATCPDDTQAAQQSVLAEDEETVMKNETPGPQGVPLCSKGETVVPPSHHAIESGLTMRLPAMREHVTTELLAQRHQSMQPESKYRGEIDKIWKIIPMLDFYKTKHELAQHLESRENAKDNELYARTNWNIYEPCDILDALQNINRSTIDNKIHRAYGQTRLVSSVNALIAQGYKPAVTSHRSDYLGILEELASKKAGSVSQTEMEQMISSNIREYRAGQKWLAVINWFSGSAAVLVFVIAGIGQEFMTKWTEFQKDCVQHIAKMLQSITRLIEILGPDALDIYCKQGRLGIECLAKVKNAEFTQPENADERLENEEENEEDGEQDDADKKDDEEEDDEDVEESEEDETDESTEDDEDEYVETEQENEDD